MRRTGMGVVALLTFGLTALPAAASVQLKTIARVGDPVAGGGTLTALSGVSVALAGALVFQGGVDNVPAGRLYRFSPGTGVQFLTTKAGFDPPYVGDDGTVAWVSGGACAISVIPPGTTSVGTAACTSGNRRVLERAVYALAVVNGQVYFLGRYDPSPVDHGDDDPFKRTGLGVFTGRDTRVAPLTYPKGWQGQYTLGIDPIWDTSAFMYGGADAPYVQPFFTSALFRVENGGITPVLGAGSGVPAPPGFLGGIAVGADRIVFAAGSGSQGGLYELADGKVQDLTAKYGDLALSDSAYVFGHLTTSGEIDRLVTLEPDGLRTLVGKGSRTADGATVTAISSAFSTPAKPDGTVALYATTSKRGKSAAAVLSVFDACLRPTAVSPFPLDGEERADVRDDQRREITNYIAELKRAIAALAEDTRKHPAHKARNDKAIAELAHLLKLAQKAVGRSFSAHTRLGADVQGVVENAKCSWLDEAKDKLKEAAKGADAKQIKELAERFGDLKQVLNGDVKPRSKEAQKLLETNLVALGEKFGGSAEHGKLTGKALTLFKTLTKQIPETELPGVFRTEVEDLAKALGGKNAGELTHHIITLVEVIRGNVDADKQYDVLKETVGALATRIGLEGLLETPQARAAMLGFELGRAFGDRIAADLKLIAAKELKKACLIALANAQGLTGHYEELDYTKNTRALVKPPFYFEGWNCVIVADASIPDYPGHALIEATSPVKTYLFGIISTGGKTQYFDPFYN